MTKMNSVEKMKNKWTDLELEFANLVAPNKRPRPPNPPKPKKDSPMKIDFDGFEDEFDEDFSFPGSPPTKATKIMDLSKIMETCNPKCSSELSVSKQKQNEIVEWLTAEGTSSGKPRIMILAGPSGCGKTVALRVLAEECDYDVVEWLTPVDSLFIGEYQGLRQSDKFIEFLVRATRYSSLFSKRKRRLLVVKDIPNIYYFDKDDFHEALSLYMEMGKTPLVFLLPDSESSKQTYKLFPPEVIEKFDIDRINVNAATPTAMKTMMKRVSTIMNAKFGDFLEVTPAIVEEVLSNSIGDVRSTILNTIFNSLRVPKEVQKSDCQCREESLGLLHGVGRVINPKRIPEENSWKFKHDPDDIAAYFKSQSRIFFHFLQENYLNTMSKIDYVEKAADIMSLSDAISSEYRDQNLTNLNLSICIRGVMVSNEFPVNGWNPVRKPRSEDAEIQRDLGVAEEHFFKRIIKPGKSAEATDSLNYNIEED